MYDSYSLCLFTFLLVFPNVPAVPGMPCQGEDRKCISSSFRILGSGYIYQVTLLVASHKITTLYDVLFIKTNPSPTSHSPTPLFSSTLYFTLLSTWLPCRYVLWMIGGPSVKMIRLPFNFNGMNQIS